jgi:hypothetical protein
LSQIAELARVKARIRALTEKTVANGCTEAEAISAAEMVGRLLERYALSMDEIEVRTARCVQAEVPMGGQRRRPIDACVPAIARFCDCKVWLTRAARPGGRYVFFGFETDTTLATYLFTVIDRAILTEAATFKQANPSLRAVRLRRASASFQHGVAARVAERLDAMHQQRQASVRARRSTGTALILGPHPRGDLVSDPETAVWRNCPGSLVGGSVHRSVPQVPRSFHGPRQAARTAPESARPSLRNSVWSGRVAGTPRR